MEGNLKHNELLKANVVQQAASTGTYNAAAAAEAQLQSGGAGRMSGRGVLLERAERLRREAAGLEALARSIPEHFPADADEGLWNLAISRR